MSPPLQCFFCCPVPWFPFDTFAGAQEAESSDQELAAAVQALDKCVAEASRLGGYLTLTSIKDGALCLCTADAL